MLPIADENRSAHARTLLCLGDQDAAAEQIIDRLQDPVDSVRASSVISDEAMKAILAQQ
ncbi:MAG: hypothetical protein MJA32_04710 [Proteobacteria bacterium]|nr:hypothetical protein [Pseudomonadota bacterium]